jgi:hypothetical protein
LGFDFVAAIFRLRKLLEFNEPFSQTKRTVEKVVFGVQKLAFAIFEFRIF